MSFLFLLLFSIISVALCAWVIAVYRFFRDFPFPPFSNSEPPDYPTTHD